MSFKRIIAKFSGEYFHDVGDLCGKIKEAIDVTELAIMCGGGNLMRGAHRSQDFRTYNDRIGMLSTLINGIQLKSNLGATIFSTIENDICFKYNIESAKEKLNTDHAIILCGGLGCGYISTDTGMVVRGLELECDCVIKVSKFACMYDSDPAKHSSAKPIYNMGYDEALNLEAFDKSAICIAQANSIPMIFTDLYNFIKLVKDEDCIFTAIG